MVLTIVAHGDSKGYDHRLNTQVYLIYGMTDDGRKLFWKLKRSLFELYFVLHSIILFGNFVLRFLNTTPRSLNTKFYR